MPHTTTYTAANEKTADAIAARIGMDGNRAYFHGRYVYRNGNEFELYASHNDHDRFNALFTSLNRVAKPAHAAAEPPATDRQISYLTTLIQRDPGAASTIGASTDGAHPVAGLTKSRASRFIDQLVAGV